MPFKRSLTDFLNLHSFTETFEYHESDDPSAENM